MPFVSFFVLLWEIRTRPKCFFTFGLFKDCKSKVPINNSRRIVVIKPGIPSRPNEWDSHAWPLIHILSGLGLKRKWYKVFNSQVQDLSCQENQSFEIKTSSQKCIILSMKILSTCCQLKTAVDLLVDLFILVAIHAFYYKSISLPKQWNDIQ